jgi:2-phospho-L-lactate guanylyltransferase
MTFAILPVKSPHHAKQRLKGYLSAEEREALARLMYRDTLAALCAARGIDRVVVATNDGEAANHARHAGVSVFEETEQHSHSVSADAACRRAMELGATTALLVPIDVPLVTATDFEALRAAAGRGLVIVPSIDGTGTNALARTPPDLIESRFGPGSFQAHVGQAHAKGVPVEVLRVEGLMFDIDTPEDVAELLARAPQSRAAGFLQAACASK